MLVYCNNLNIYSPDSRLINGPITFELNAGDVLNIQGANGSGKTTLLKTLLGVHQAYKGSLSFKVQKNQVSYLPQLSGLDFLIPLKLKDILSFSKLKKSFFPINLENYWNQASGGERQKTLLSQCLQTPAELYILDEPFNHLDAQSKIILKNKIKSMQAENCAFILVSHEALDIGTKSINLDELQND